MNVKTKKGSWGAMDFVIPALCALYLVGILFPFRPCAPAEDGSYMHCHYAGLAVAGLAAALLALSAVRLFLKKAKQKAVLDILMVLVSLVALAVPGRLIPLCMMAEMRCRAMMKPFAVVCSVLVCAAAAADAIGKLWRERKQ